MAEVKKPSDLPKANKHKPMKNLKMSLELLQTLSPLYQTYLSSNDQLLVQKDHRPVSPLRTNTLKTKTTSGDVEFGPAIQSARSHDYGCTVLCKDLCVLSNDEHWTVTPQTH